MTRAKLIVVAASLLVIFGCSGGSGARLDEAARLSRGEGGPLAGERLAVLCEDRDPRVRAMAMVGLVRIAPGQGGDAILLGLGDSDPQVRAVAARSAGALRLQEATVGLSALLLADPSEEVRLQAAAALAGMPGPAAGEALARGVDDPTEGVRLVAIRGLSPDGARLAARTLAARALGDASWEVRAASVEALARAEVTAAWIPVEAAAADRSEFVRAASKEAQERLRAAGVPRTEVATPPPEPVYTPRPDPNTGGSIGEPPGSP